MARSEGQRGKQRPLLIPARALGHVALACRSAFPSAQGSPSSWHRARAQLPAAPRPARFAPQQQLCALTADACPARHTGAPSQPQRGSSSPVRTYVCAKDSVRHLGVSERQGEKQGYQGALLSPAPAVLAGAPLPTLVRGRGLWALPACGRTSAARVEPLVVTKCSQIAVIFGQRCSRTPVPWHRVSPWGRGDQQDGTARSLLGLYYTDSFILL